jgi:hypothetical protein
MSSRTNERESIYGDYVKGKVKEQGGVGGGVYTFPEISSWLGLKPTHNLRKRLRTLEKEGLLWIGYGYIGKCGTCLVYHINDFRPQPPSNLDIPF